MQYKCDNDYELLYLIKEEQIDYTNALFIKYKPLINKFAYKYYFINKNKGYEFEDFYQEACIAFFDSIKGYDTYKKCVAQFNTYLINCIKNRLISYVRKISSHKYCFDFVEFDENSIYEENKTLDIGVIDDLRLFLYDIPLLDSCVYELRINGFSYKEISLLLDIPIRKVEYLLKKCRTKFNIYINRII